MTIAEAQEAIIEDFNLLEEEGMDKYEYLIELGRNLSLIDDCHKTDQYLIEGCQSKVWLYAEFDGEKVTYKADSNTALTKGIISLLVKLLTNRDPQEIIDARIDFVDKVGFQGFLSAQRANGLLAMLKQMKMYALAFSVQKNKS